MTRTLSLIHKRVYDGLNHRLRWVAGGRLAGWCRPTWISLLFTERCNARCVHCDIWKNRGREDAPSADQWRTVLSDLRRWLGPAHVCITGGEALLVPHTIELVRQASSLGLLVEVLSHGYWGDQSRIEGLARARPWRVTVSLDGLGDVHSLIRGRDGFFERTRASLATLNRLRREERLGFSILLKTVIMRQNLDELERLARFATDEGMEIFYQPIEQNYNTPDDPAWYQHSDTWPTDPARAVAAVERLIALKAAGLAISNSVRQLEVMIPYFRDPAATQAAVRDHTAHDRHQTCAALSLLQIQANGDVHVCIGTPPIGNIKTERVPDLWRRRPQWWVAGCCKSAAGADG